jgi:hypothetical protein
LSQEKGERKCRKKSNGLESGRKYIIIQIKNKTEGKIEAKGGEK